MSVDSIRLSQKAKEQLIKLKRGTGIKNWNILCRWAFMVSLAEPTSPAPAKIPADSNVEMSWKVFGGAHHEFYLAVLKMRCVRDQFGCDDDVLATQFRLHLHRGIGYMAAVRGRRHIVEIIERAVKCADPNSDSQAA